MFIFYKKILFQPLYFKISCLIQCYFTFLCNYLWNLLEILSENCFTSIFCSSFIIYIVHIRISWYMNLKSNYHDTIWYYSYYFIWLIFVTFYEVHKTLLTKPHGNIVILYSIMIISYSFSWFSVLLVEGLWMNEV